MVSVEEVVDKPLVEEKVVEEKVEVGRHLELEENNLHSAIIDYDLTVILPCYNEEDNIHLTVAMIYQALHKLPMDDLVNEESAALESRDILGKPLRYLKYEIIIVEDSSSDDTLGRARQLMEKFDDLPMAILCREGKLGLGSAYKDASKYCGGIHVCILDADLSHNPKDIPILLRKAIQTKVDIVYGTRYDGGGGVFGWPWYRIAMSVGANLMWNVLMGTKITDGTGSYRIYKKNVFNWLCRVVLNDGFGFQLEAITRASREGLKIDSVPINFVDRVFGDSKMGMEEVRRMISVLIPLMMEI